MTRIIPLNKEIPHGVAFNLLNNLFQMWDVEADLLQKGRDSYINNGFSIHPGIPFLKTDKERSNNSFVVLCWWGIT